MAANGTIDRVLTEARKHQALIERDAEGELIRLLTRAWADTGLSTTVPVRGGESSDFWRRVGQQLATRLSTEAESVSVLMGMVAHDVVQWAAEHGIPAEKYEYFVGLLVAWTTLAVLKRRKRNPKRK